MDPSELSNLSNQELINLLEQSQETILQLEARVKELEASRLEQSPSEPPSTRSHASHHRRHRRWYKRLWRTMFAGGTVGSQYIIAIIIMLAVNNQDIVHGLSLNF